MAGDTNTSLVVSWKNPNQPNITGFHITWFNVANISDGDTEELNSTTSDVSLLPGARVIYNITGLTSHTVYRITIAVLYENGDAAVSAPIEKTTEADPDGGGNPVPDPLAVSGIRTIVSGNNIIVSWTNPNRESISGFNINWINVGDDADTTARGEMELTDSLANVVAGASDNTYKITNLNYAATYRITVTVRYADGTSVASTSVEGITGTDPDDIDGDGVANADDLDYDGDGLIEIHSLDQLALLRDDLDGDGDDDENIDEITAVGSAGCPVSDSCRGYELTRSLNFSDAASYLPGSANKAAWTNRSGSGWQPIGSCSARNTCTPWTAVFDGGGYSIADLFISVNHTVNGIGLFGAFNGTIQNLHLQDANVSGGANDVGLLAGYGRNARYENLSVIGGVIMSASADSVGGLVGDASGADTMMHAVSVSDATVAGDDQIGGLVGDGRDATLRAAFVSDATVRAADDHASADDDRVGGLVGDGRRATIHAAAVSDVTVAGDNRLGGLVGDGEGATIRAVSVSDANITALDAHGGTFIGGVLGNGIGADVRHSYVVRGSVGGLGRRAAPASIRSVGGLFGTGMGANVRYSYVASGEISGNVFFGGLIGSSAFFITTTFFIASYWNTQTTRQSLVSSGVHVGKTGTAAKTTAELQTPTNFTGTDNIYALWGNFWCDPVSLEIRETTDAGGPGAPFIRLWDLGAANQYPALNCLPLSPAQQRQ